MSVVRHLYTLLQLFVILAGGYMAYMDWFYKVPDPIPCRQGMTLAPRQSCYGEVDIQVPETEK